MLIGVVSFLRPNQELTSEERWKLEDALMAYLGQLAKNGQLVGEAITAWTPNGLVGHVRLAGPDSFERHYTLPSGLRELDEVESILGPSSWRVSGQRGRERPELRNCKYLYLHTGADEPLRDLVTGAILPAYLLGAEESLMEQIDCWGRAARAVSTLYYGSWALGIGGLPPTR